MKTVKKTYLIALLGQIISCGAPLGPVPSPWQVLASFDGDRYSIFDIAADGDVVYFPVETIENDVAVIKRYRNGTLSDVFTLDLKGGKAAGFNDIAVAAGTGWAVGYREFGKGNGWHHEPFLLQYDTSRGWREVTLGGGTPDGAFTEVVPINGESCWLLFKKRAVERTEPATLWKYESGALEEFGAVKADAVAYDATTATTYALTVRRKEGVQVLISVTGGASWQEEEPNFESPGDFYAGGIIPWAAEGVLYIAANDGGGFHPRASAIYRRTGAPGAGEYELLVYCPEGPNFSSFYALAVDRSGRILGVGDETSLFYDGEQWAQESLPNKNNFEDVIAGLTGFYAVGANGMSMALPIELLYHP